VLAHLIDSKDCVLGLTGPDGIKAGSAGNILARGSEVGVMDVRRLSSQVPLVQVELALEYHIGGHRLPRDGF
jgi:hypothetical protein